MDKISSIEVSVHFQKTSTLALAFHFELGILLFYLELFTNKALKEECVRKIRLPIKIINSSRILALVSTEPRERTRILNR